MESMVMKLFRQLIELGVFGKSWVPILSKKYLIGVYLGRLTVSRNDGPGVIGVHESVNCTHLVTLKADGGTEWGNIETFGEHELEQVLQALIDVYPPELKEIAALGFSSMQWPNLPQLLERLDTLSIREAVQALTEKGLFLANQFPMITDDKQFAVFFSKTPQMISICKNDGDINQHSEPGLLGSIGGFTRICHLRNESITWSHDGYGTKHVEDILNELHTKFVASQKVDPLAGLGRGLTAEASAKLFKEQNPHLFPPADRDAIALSRPGDTGYFFMLDADGNPVHIDGSPLSVNDGKGNLLMGGDAMSFMQKRIQAGLKPEPDDTTVPDWWAQGQVGSKGYIPRDRFKDVEYYITHLERVIELSRMTSAEFKEDARRSGEELEQMYSHRMEPINPLPRHPHVSNYLPQVDTSIVDDILRDPGATIFHYIPQADEPSPFGPEQENYVDNPWVVWKNQQEGYDAQHQGSTVLLREALIEQLKAERYRSQVDRRDVPFELQTSSGKLSLGYVIHIRYSHPMEWEEAHNYGMSKIKQFNQSR